MANLFGDDMTITQWFQNLNKKKPGQPGYVSGNQTPSAQQPGTQPTTNTLKSVSQLPNPPINNVPTQPGPTQSTQKNVKNAPVTSLPGTKTISIPSPGSIVVQPGTSSINDGNSTVSITPISQPLIQLNVPAYKPTLTIQLTGRVNDNEKVSNNVVYKGVTGVVLNVTGLTPGGPVGVVGNLISANGGAHSQVNNPVGDIATTTGTYSWTVSNLVDVSGIFYATDLATGGVTNKVTLSSGVQTF